MIRVLLYSWLSVMVSATIMTLIHRYVVPINILVIIPAVLLLSGLISLTISMKEDDSGCGCDICCPWGWSGGILIFFMACATPICIVIYLIQVLV